MPIRVGLIQINSEFAGQCYFPYAAGLLEAFAQRHLPDPQNYEFFPPVFRRDLIADAAAKLRGADILAISLYSWNEQLSMAIAERVKREQPSTLIVCGGPQVPKHSPPRDDRPWEVEEFLTKYPFVDLAVHEAGEGAFLQILQHARNGNWERLPSASYLDRGRLIQTPLDSGFKDYSEVPDPYLAGVFDPLIGIYPQMQWIGLVETDRNCPYTCTFCSWPGVGKKPILRPLEEVARTLEWLADHQVGYIFFVNANFGINREHDLEIIRQLVRIKLERGFPHAVNLQDGKNVAKWVIRIRQELAKGGIDSPAAMALQSLNPATLKAIERDNIKLEAYHEIQAALAAMGQPTVTDLILGLPEETLDSFKRGVGEVIRRGQHGRIFFHNLSLVPDAALSHPVQVEFYGLESVRIRFVSIHGFIEREEVPEHGDIVIAARTMPREDWARAKAFAFAQAFYHAGKVLAIPFVVCHEAGDTGNGEFVRWCRLHAIDPASFPLSLQLDAGRVASRYDQLLDLFVADDLDPAVYPLLAEVRDFFLMRARAIQAGDVEHPHDPEALDAYWPADEYMLIKIVREGLLDQLYEEAERRLAEGVVINRRLLRQAFELNHALLKLPFRSGEHVAECGWSIFEFYQSVRTRDPIGSALVEGFYRYRIDWSAESWHSWEEWYRKVVWFGSRGANYFSRPQPAVPSAPVPAGHY